MPFPYKKKMLTQLKDLLWCVAFAYVAGCIDAACCFPRAYVSQFSQSSSRLALNATRHTGARFVQRFSVRTVEARHVVSFRGQGICNRQRHSGSASLSSALNVNGLTFFPGIYADMPLLVDDLRRVSHYERLTPHYETYTCTRIIGLRYKEHLSISLFFFFLARCDITFYIPLRALRSPRRAFSPSSSSFSFFGLSFKPIFRIASSFVMTFVTHIFSLLLTPTILCDLKYLRPFLQICFKWQKVQVEFLKIWRNILILEICSLYSIKQYSNKLQNT